MIAGMASTMLSEHEMIRIAMVGVDIPNAIPSAPVDAITTPLPNHPLMIRLQWRYSLPVFLICDVLSRIAVS